MFMLVQCKYGKEDCNEVMNDADADADADAVQTLNNDIIT
jgi:hypothetical protein